MSDEEYEVLGNAWMQCLLIDRKLDYWAYLRWKGHAPTWVAAQMYDLVKQPGDYTIDGSDGWLPDLTGQSRYEASLADEQAEREASQALRDA